MIGKNLKKIFQDGAKHIVFGAFYKETNQLCGYAWINEFDSYVDFACMKVNPEYERLGINAAIVYSIIDMYNKRLCKAFHICDGARATIHETNFQDYLEKYFGFRKAYCKLKIRYRFPIGIIVKMLYLFRNIIPKDNRLTVKISNMLLYEEIARESR